MVITEEKLAVPDKTSVSDEIKHVTISLKQEMARRAELQAIRRDLLALAEQDSQIKRQVYEHGEKIKAIAGRVLALINN